MVSQRCIVLLGLLAAGVAVGWASTRRGDARAELLDWRPAP